MKITHIKISLADPMKDDPKVKAYVNIIFNECFAVRHMRIIEAYEKRLVCFPARQLKDGTHSDYCHPVSKDFRNYVNETILKEYDNVRLGNDSKSAH